MTFVSLHNYLIGLKPLLAALLLLLMTAFGTVAVFGAPEDWSQATYPIAAPKLVAQPVNLTNTARAPPTTITNVMATGTAFARTGNLRTFDGVEASKATHALLHSSNAPNRTVTDFVDGVTVTDIRTGRTISGTVYLRPTLDRIENGGSFPHGRDGSIFQNRPVAGRAQPELPTQAQGYYTEYVHPTPGISGPGPQRIVTGAGGEIYYTPDHYSTFIRLDQ